MLLLGILPAALLIAAGVTVWSTTGFGGAVLVVIGAAIGALALLVSRALSGIFGVALYRYAHDGEPVGGFTPAELDSAVRRGQGAPARGTI